MFNCLVAQTLQKEHASKPVGQLRLIDNRTGVSDTAVACYASINSTARLSVKNPLQEGEPRKDQVSLDSLSSILRVTRAGGHPARLAFVHAMPAAAAARGRAGTVAQLLPLATELAVDADEGVREAVALQLVPLGERPSPQGPRQCGARMPCACIP